uniref:OTU domain-containing protein n=1 Tax=Ditylenchus dipsaci TaxID=166011 RepID=A0A915DVJ6_9BILA
MVRRHEANPADPLRNQRKKTFERNEEQLQALVEAYSKVDPPLRDQVSFIRHIQLHLAKKSNDKLPSFFKGIEADGNCLYRSLAEAVYGEEDRHAQVRMEMMQYLLDIGEKPFARFFTAIGDKSATVEEYAAHFNQPSKTSQQLLLAAKLYDKNMILFQPKDSPQYVKFSDEPKKIFRSNGQAKRVYTTRKVPLKPGVNSVLIRYQNSHFDLGWIG